ncbi:N-methyl-L-tryptophan oxidase [Virgibacillus salexigens]|uniref:N-methyltryptophan oxidase n=1 Tax=Virgibacillus kapii TaxID=1638645 RepID=A0ABQ2DQY1_9BACI|nr:N-methyl-L-tryptophan oxidase [Virgibacillus kapii]GGJ68346.1 N-methyltryptophan oxidase [Virgibacillus kapii]
MDAEIGVIGLGTMGSMTMWQLAKARVNAIGFEQFGIGHDRSAAGGETRMFRTAYKEGKQYVPLLKDAYMLWRELESETGNELLQLTKGLIIGDPNSGTFKNVRRSIQAYNLEHKLLTNDEAEHRFYQHKLFENDQIMIDGAAGYLRSQYAIVSAVSRAIELGATIYSHTEVDTITSDEDGVTIYAEGERYRVQKVIITAGPWATNFIGEFTSFLEVRRLVNAWFLPKDMESFREGDFPVFIRENVNNSYYGFPLIDGNMVKLGLRATAAHRLTDAASYIRDVTSEEIHHFKHLVNRDLPGLHSDPSRMEAFMELYTKDHHPIIGKLPHDHRVIVLTGFSGHGFKMATVMGRIAAELALHGETHYDISLFAPKRFVNLGVM